LKILRDGVFYASNSRIFAGSVTLFFAHTAYREFGTNFLGIVSQLMKNTSISCQGTKTPALPTLGMIVKGLLHPYSSIEWVLRLYRQNQLGR